LTIISQKIVVVVQFLGLAALIFIYSNTRTHKENTIQNEYWIEDYDAAQKQAEIENKPILIYFSKGDRCMECHDFYKEIIAHPEFIAFAKDHLVLLRLQYPVLDQLNLPATNVNYQLGPDPDMSKQTDESPMIIILDKKGKMITSTGLFEGGARSFLTYVKRKLDQP